MRSINFLLPAFIAVLLAPASIAAAQSPVGVWIDDTGRGAVEISECGGGKLCGKLVWLKDPAASKACGTAIIGDAAKIGESWDGGWIYSPEKKSKYDVELTPDGADKLTVLGYAGTKLFSREMTWTRAPADLKRCDTGQQEANAAAPATTDAKPADVKETAPDAPTQAATPPAKAVQTAQVDDSKPAAKPEAAAPPKTARKKTRMCRVDAPFVRVDFPCDDD